MKIVTTSELNKKVRNWWNQTPFTYNLDKKLSKPDKSLFLEADRKFRKWHPWGQVDDTAMSAKIDYASLKGKRVLDIAIGLGWSTEQLIRAGAEVSAIDIAPEAVKLTKLRCRLFGLPKTDIRVADAQALPYKNGTFDYVLAWGCLMHMPDTAKAIAEIFRVLKPGGRVQVMMYHKHSLNYWYYIWLSQGILRGQLAQLSEQELINRYTDGQPTGGNPLAKMYSKKEFQQLFAQFEDFQIEFHDANTYLDFFPHKKLPLGQYLPQSIKDLIFSKWGYLAWISCQKPSSLNNRVSKVIASDQREGSSQWGMQRTSLTTHRHWETFFATEAKKLFQAGIVLDVGGGMPYQKELEHFDKKHRAFYVSTDYDPHTQPHVVSDAHALPFKSNSIDAVILKSVLEHVQNPFTVMEEIKRVLKPGGVLLLWVPFLFSYHAAPSYQDFYRFSQDGVAYLLKDFSEVTLVPTRAYWEMLVTLLPHPLNQWLKSCSLLLDQWLPVRNQYSGFGAWARL